MPAAESAPTTTSAPATTASEEDAGTPRPRQLARYDSTGSHGSSRSGTSTPASFTPRTVRRDPDRDVGAPVQQPVLVWKPSRNKIQAFLAQEHPGVEFAPEDLQNIESSLEEFCLRGLIKHVM